MYLVTATGMDAFELRDELAELPSEVGVIAPPDIESASLDFGNLAIEAVKGLPALLTAIAALWEARKKQSAKRTLKAVSLEKSDGVTVRIAIDDLNNTSVRLELSEGEKDVRQIRLELADAPET